MQIANVTLRSVLTPEALLLPLNCAGISWAIQAVATRAGIKKSEVGSISQ